MATRVCRCPWPARRAPCELALEALADALDRLELVHAFAMARFGSTAASRLLFARWCTRYSRLSFE
jgi:hypothetical protein